MAVAALDSNHEAHTACRLSVLELRPALAGHAAFECYAVLTRIPPPLRLTGLQAYQVLSQAFPEECWLEKREWALLMPRLAELGILGGAVYDALVGHAAGANRRALLTRDRRAERTYRALEIDFQTVV